MCYISSGGVDVVGGVVVLLTTTVLMTLFVCSLSLRAGLTSA